MNKVTSFEHACTLLNILPVRPDVSGIPEEFRERTIAQYDLEVICKATDPKFVADYKNWQQQKWFPIHINDGSGFRFSATLYTHSYTRTGLGSWPLPSDEAAEHVGTQFLELFKILAGE